jgi:acylpyruvate hydrolase
MKIFCVGRNYEAHIKELNNAVPSNPVIFMKPATAIFKGENWYHPDFSNDIHYEVELILKIKKNGKQINEKFAHNYIDSIGLGIDFTARDIQQDLKTKGLPWELAKSFDNAALISERFIDFEYFNEKSIQFSLQKNENIVQHGNSKDLIFSFTKLISFISKYFTLNTGDLIFTGTPNGVGKVSIGDKYSGYLENDRLFSFTIK